MSQDPGPAPTGDADLVIGRIVSIAGSQIIVVLEDQPGESAPSPSPPPPPQVGSVVRMRARDSVVFGLVTGLNIPIPAMAAGEAEMKIIEVELLGEVVAGEAITEDGGAPSPFLRGVSVYPGLGEPVYAASAENLRTVYARPSITCVPVGTVHNDRNVPAYLSVDDLLGRHFAVLGSTGTGKSCVVALILRRILTQIAAGHVLVIDLHNEYSHAFGDLAEVLTHENLDLPYWLLNFEEMREIMVSARGSQPEVEAAILSDTILEAKRILAAGTDAVEWITVDTPVPYRLSDVVRLLDEKMGRLQRPSDTEPYLRLKARLATLSSDRRYAFMFPGITVRDNLAAILGTLYRVPTRGRPITILDLSGVPSEVLDAVVSLICRMTFDFAQASDQQVPVLLVCEEAHRYAPLDAALGFASTKQAVGRIAKEGRKYGVSLCLVSQRPSELAAGMLAQCNTILALRLSNQRDQDFVRATLTESGLGLVDSLPSLRDREAIAVGQAVSVPLRLFFDDLPPHQRPKSGAASYEDAWGSEVDAGPVLDAVVRRMRLQGSLRLS